MKAREYDSNVRVCRRRRGASKSKSPRTFAFTSRARLARQLLYLSWGFLMTGCLVPSDLVLSDGTINYPPAFVSADPLFGPITRTTTFGLTGTITVVDPNPEPENLHARIFIGLPNAMGQRDFTGIEFELTPNGPGATTRTGSTPPNVTVCSASSTGSTQAYYVVVVDNLGFADTLGFDGGTPDASPPPPNAIAPNSYAIENYWAITCD